MYGADAEAVLVEHFGNRGVAEDAIRFGTDTNRVTILTADGATTELPQLTKREVADRILDLVAAALDARDGAAQTGATRQPASEPA